MFILTCVNPTKEQLQQDLETIRACAGIQILETIDEEFPSQLLVQGDNKAVAAMMLLLPHWKMQEESQIPLPDTRHKAN